MKTLIRAESSYTIGTGHIMRCLVLAKRDFYEDEVLFAVRELDGNINRKITDEGLDIEILESNDVSELISLIKERNIERVVIDNYDIGYDEEYEIKQQTNCEIFVLDDTYEKHYCDVLLNHNIYAQAERYSGLVPNGCELRCGKKYTLVREEFIVEKDKRYNSETGCIKVLVAIGGADGKNLTPEIVDVLQEYKTFKPIIVTTSANKNLSTLQQISKRDDIELHIDTTEMAKLMKRSNLSIVTPSVLLNEVCFLGVDFIAIHTAKNQEEMCKYLKRKGYSLIEKFTKNKLKVELKTKIKNLR